MGFHHFGDDIGMEAATIDKSARAIIAPRSLQNEFLMAFENAENLLGQTNIAARRPNPGGICLGDFLIVDDAGFRDAESLGSDGMGLELFEARCPDYFQALEAIGHPSTMQLIEARQLFLARCYDYFTAQFVRHGIFIAELDQRFSPGDTAARL
jgi:hypothetical protein